MGCNKFPRCRTIVSMKVIDQLKDLQAKGQWPPATTQRPTKSSAEKKQAAKRQKLRSRKLV